ncbi:hypothetical protein TRIUR3_12505 [Triticum urartu]|uniref:Uncharacterized protein n=2 Tax=Triticum TaxID=4564 RepID=A0A9R0Q062_TRITD|nr:hypothetical protein TRIUR3_12505 [Triticum urartu]VAH01200.1 unnamed protein product [Triticum turgidum subsp. durum]
MALSRRMTASALLLLFLLVATEMGTTTTKVAEARDCLSQSHNMDGLVQCIPLSPLSLCKCDRVQRQMLVLLLVTTAFSCDKTFLEAA